MNTIIILKEKEAIANRACDIVISTLRKMPQLISKNNELIIKTNMIYEGIELLKHFSDYLAILKMQGITHIIIDLEKNSLCGPLVFN